MRRIFGFLLTSFAIFPSGSSATMCARSPVSRISSATSVIRPNGILELRIFRSRTNHLQLLIGKG